MKLKKEEELFMPRKVPQQPRALVTVESILQAAESIISQSGYEVASTNHIAEVAGVSIGSLYQYFPSKEAIAAALVEKAVVSAAGRMRECLLACMTLPLAESTPQLVRLILETRKEHAFIFLRLPREVPKLGKISRQMTTEKFLYTTIHAYYIQHRDEIKVENLETAMFVAEHLVVGSINAYIEDNSPKLTDEELVKHISDAVIKYLTK
jgi:AcrR family transcriptional regulator